MDFKSGKSMFSDIKSKLGFGSNDDYDGYEDGYDDEFEADEYAEYDDFTDYDSYGDNFDDGYSKSASLPRLVSKEDVRAGSYSSSFSRDSSRYGSRRGERSTLSSRTMVDSSLPPQMTPEGTAAEAASSNRRRAEGIDALFNSSSDTTGANTGVSTRDKSSFSSRDAHTPSTLTPTNYGSTRKVVIVVPASYEDAAKVTAALKVGDAVVLDLRTTAPDLMARLLDFSFGAASALDAKVDCIGSKVFALTRVRELNSTELSDLRTQGLIA